MVHAVFNMSWVQFMRIKTSGTKLDFICCSFRFLKGFRSCKEDVDKEETSQRIFSLNWANLEGIANVLCAEHQ